MARTKNPHQAAIKSWETRRSAHGQGTSPTQLRRDHFRKWEGVFTDNDPDGYLGAHGQRRIIGSISYKGKRYELDSPTLGKAHRAAFEQAVGMTLDDIADLAGAPPGSEVELEIRRTESTAFDYEREDIEVNVRFPDYSGQTYRLISPDTGVIHNMEMSVSKEMQGQGLGTASFGLEVAAAIRLGFKEIQVTAAGGPGSTTNGYYTWARLGFQSEEVFKGPDGMWGGVQHIMMQPGGAKWWKENGGSFFGSFDLSEGSVSRRLFDEYRRLKREAA
jgi:GNAT superfamily N-acetyltransferase